MIYPLDWTGSASSNLISGETIDLVDSSSALGGLVFLQYAPFTLQTLF